MAELLGGWRSFPRVPNVQEWWALSIKTSSVHLKGNASQLRFVEAHGGVSTVVLHAFPVCRRLGHT